jgi:hypothetical protein
LVTQLDRTDWEGIDKLAGTQISTEIKDYYNKLDDYFPGVSDAFSFQKAPSTKIGNLYNELKNNSKFKLKEFFLQKRPLRVRKLLLDAAKQHSNLRFVENSIALYLVQKQYAESDADHLVISKDGKIEQLQADYFVISAGALETPRLCLQSIQNGFSSLHNENMGRFLSDHPWAVIGELISKKGNFRLSVTDTYATKKLLHRTGLLPKIEKNNLPVITYNNHGIALKPIYFGEYAEFKEILKSIISMQWKFANIVKLFKKYKISNILSCLMMLIYEKSRIRMGAYINRALVFCYLEQTPNRNSCITLTSSIDKYGRSVPEINWIFNESDMHEASKVSEYMFKSFAESRNFYFKPYELKCESFASGAHHAGTMKIGSDQRNGVIDNNLKIFGTNNIYVCDLSIFPKYGNSNPTLTLSAFSVRLSQHLLQRIT